MQSRVSFSSGEFSPEMSMRSDMEQYVRACSRLENWDVKQTGGVDRRRGMRRFANALADEVHIVPYIYSYANETGYRFLVEIAAEKVRIINPDTGKGVKTFSSSTTDPFSFVPENVRYFQVNKLLFLTEENNPPHVIEYDGSTWKMYQWEFKYLPYRYNHEDRDWPIRLKVVDGAVESLDFSSVEDSSELPSEKYVPENLQASFYIEQQEVTARGQNMRNGVKIVKAMPSTATKGQKFAMQELTNDNKYFVCIETWYKANYVSGLESPANYTSNFKEAEASGDLKNLQIVYSVNDISGEYVAKGDAIAMKSAYWDYWYCYKAVPDGVTLDADKSFEDYPEYFWHGLPIGTAVTCQSGWSFYCSGVWYGKYEVLRNYDNPAYNANWETRGTSFSRNFATSNYQVSDSEKDEECYLRLRLVKSRCMEDPVYNADTGEWEADLVAGFPADSCDNRLIVNSYKHNTVLQCTHDGSKFNWTVQGTVKILSDYSKEIYDWSWQAFGKRYGYPLNASLYNSRLIFASTREQPQTVWLSKTDDLKNFLTGSLDTSSIWLTFSTRSQDPICWMNEQSGYLVCATASEICAITNPSKTTLTASNAVRVHLSAVGSSDIPVVLAEDKAIYVGRGGWRVYQFAYDYEANGLISTDISIFASHIGKDHKGFKCGAMAEKPDPVVYYVMNDGTMSLCTYNSMQSINAWHRWTTDGTVKDVCIMPNGDERDRVFLVTTRETGTFIELIDDYSTFVDNGDRDYVSTLVTNPLENPAQEFAHKKNSSHLYIRFGDGVTYQKNIKVSKDAFKHSYLLDCKTGDFSNTWKELVAPVEWDWELTGGVSVSGDYACSILAIQG